MNEMDNLSPYKSNLKFSLKDFEIIKKNLMERLDGLDERWLFRFKNNELLIGRLFWFLKLNFKKLDTG